MRILLTNDDGIEAPGLAALYGELVGLGEVIVVAPAAHKSGASHAITINAPVTAERVCIRNEMPGWSIGGSPADCVKLAMDRLLESPPDLVVSGINDGANVSINVLYSGTVAAAAEAAILGLPGVAVSMDRGEAMDYAWAARIASSLIRQALEQPLQPRDLLNINIPNLAAGPPRGVRVAHQAVQRMNDGYEHRSDPDQEAGYYLRGWFTEPDGDLESDLNALTDGFIAVTPLHLDLTARQQLAAWQTRDWGPLPS